MNPKVSVLLPAYNVEAYIESSVKSILNQSYNNFELIVVDDCSSDSTTAILRDLAKNDARVMLLRNSHNRGIVYTLNRALKMANGVYVARMDGDDLSMPGRLAIQVGALEQSGSDICGGAYNIIDGSGILLNTHYPTLNPSDIINLAHIDNPFVHGSVCIRRSFLLKHKLQYSEKFRHAEDYHLWVRMLSLDAKPIFCPQVLYSWRVNNSGVSATNTAVQAKLKKTVSDYLWKRNLISKFKPGAIRESKNINIARYPIDTAIMSNNYLIESYCRLLGHLLVRLRLADSARLLITLTLSGPRTAMILLRVTFRGR